MNDDRSIINLLSHLIIIFDLFCDEYDDFEFKKKLVIKIQIEIILRKKSVREYKK